MFALCLVWRRRWCSALCRVGQRVWRQAWRSALIALATAGAFGAVSRAANAADAAESVAAEKVFALDITAGKTPAAQQAIRVQKNDPVKLRIKSDTAGEVHLHAYRQDIKLAPGTPAEISFKAHATGRFRIEWHGAAGTEIKPAKAATSTGAHHAPPLAVLEVRPK